MEGEIYLIFHQESFHLFQSRGVTVTSTRYDSELTQWRIQGRGPGGLPSLLYFQTKLRPEGPEKFFGRPVPPSPYLRVWMIAPPYLKVWIRHCNKNHHQHHHKNETITNKSIFYGQILQAKPQSLTGSLIAHLEMRARTPVSEETDSLFQTKWLVYEA